MADLRKIATVVVPFLLGVLGGGMRERLRSLVTLIWISAVSLLLSSTLTAGGEKKVKPPQPSVSDNVVVDSQAGLMWTKKDNGRDIDWPSAQRYCEGLELQGYSDWGLPSIEELEPLYDPKSQDWIKIRKPFRLTEWRAWSSTKQGSDSAWYFAFRYGRRFGSRLDVSYSSRALCVRRSGE